MHKEDDKEMRVRLDPIQSLCITIIYYHFRDYTTSLPFDLLLAKIASYSADRSQANQAVDQIPHLSENHQVHKRYSEVLRK